VRDAFHGDKLKDKHCVFSLKNGHSTQSLRNKFQLTYLCQGAHVLISAY